MNRNILLVEPNYQNKYPPIGLMKISTYHRKLNDKITFYKGNLDDFVLTNIKDECVKKLNFIDNSINWPLYSSSIYNFIKTKNKIIIDEIPFKKSRFDILLYHCLLDHSDYFRKKIYRRYPQYDRIYVSTLFTFYWDITIKTINFVKLLVKDKSQLVVGGVTASLLPHEIEKETGIKPIQGLLNKAGMLDKGNHFVIDDLPLDYSILYEIDYNYPTQSAYFTFMTKGCTRKCEFCSVPKLEPEYKSFIRTQDKFEVTNDQFGEQQNLLLMDNNVLASPNFKEIIDEIKIMGFTKDTLFREPNQLDIAIRNLKHDVNDKAFINRSYKLIHQLFHNLRNVKNDTKQKYYNLLERYGLVYKETVTKKGLLQVYPKIKEIYEKYRSKNPRKRYVDFNQGVDCRYITEENMKLISEIPIRPLRIAFDYIGLKKQYIKAVELAAKYGIKELSNYILYNFKDKPDELYERLKINLELGEKLGIHIYSFPMKYIPLSGEDAKHRNYIGPFWNKKFIRAIQSILNVTKGIVAPGRSFFEKAFGNNLEEYHNLLYMPETYIVYRYLFEELQYTQKWFTQYKSLNPEELSEAKKIIEINDFSFLEEKTKNSKILDVLMHYKIKRGDVSKEDTDYKKLKSKFDKLIKKDVFIDLSLSSDFDDEIQNSIKIAN